jgi:hypothetical protein
VEVEVRPIMEFADFGDALPPELIEHEKCLRAQTEQLAKGANK